MTKPSMFRTTLTSSNENYQINLLQQGYTLYSHRALTMGGVDFDADNAFDIYFFPSIANDRYRFVTMANLGKGNNNNEEKDEEHYRQEPIEEII